MSDDLKCSRAGCQSVAVTTVIWRNPKIHKDGRVKTWLACTEHLSYLVDYLDSRSFFLETKPL